MKKLLYLLLIVPFAFTSCEKDEDKCENCGLAVEILLDQAAQDSIDVLYLETMNMTYEEYINSMYASDSEEYCGDDLTDIKATEDVVVPGMYRYYIDCN